MKFLKAAILLASLSFSAQHAAAGIIYDNPWNGALSGNCRFECNDDAIGAAKFVATADSIVRSLTFETYTEIGANLSGLTVGWGIWTDTGTTPSPYSLVSSEIAPVITNLGNIDSTYDRVEYALNIPDFMLDAGDYWVSFDVNLPNDSFAIYWAQTNFGNSISADGRVRSGGDVRWSEHYAGRDDFVFSVRDNHVSVPVPTTLALLGVALCALFSSRSQALRFTSNSERLTALLTAA
jgi:hypothetical protein